MFDSMRLLYEWVEEERTRLTLEGLADIDAGRVIAHAAVKAWADSLNSEKPLPLPTREAR